MGTRSSEISVVVHALYYPLQPLYQSGRKRLSYVLLCWPNLTTVSRYERLWLFCMSSVQLLFVIFDRCYDLFFESLKLMLIANRSTIKVVLSRALLTATPPTFLHCFKILSSWNQLQVLKKNIWKSMHRWETYLESLTTNNVSVKLAKSLWL